MTFGNEFNDDEYEYQESKEQMTKYLKHQQRFQQEENQKYVAQQNQAVFNEALAEAGLSQDQFNALVQQNPEVVQKTFKENVKNYVTTIASKPRNAQGQFIKETEANRANRADKSTMGMGRRNAEQGKRFDPDNHAGTDQDMANMVQDFIGDDPLMKYTK